MSCHSLQLDTDLCAQSRGSGTCVTLGAQLCASPERDKGVFASLAAAQAFSLRVQQVTQESPVSDHWLLTLPGSRKEPLSWFSLDLRPSGPSALSRKRFF